MTYNSIRLLRLPIDVGISPLNLFEDKNLNNPCCNDKCEGNNSRSDE